MRDFPARVFKDISIICQDHPIIGWVTFLGIWGILTNDLVRLFLQLGGITWYN